jgi:hypothetical protein
METHVAWWREQYGNDAAATINAHKYLLAGGDPLADFVDECRKQGQRPFVSLRLNDVHHVENIDVPDNRRGAHAISKFYFDHKDLRLGPDLKDWNQKTLDWAHDAPREYMLSLIREQCEDHDLAGFELDFMRHPSFFNLKQTTFEQRADIMVDFVAEVRRILDETGNDGGPRRSLSVRIPAHIAQFDKLGIVPARFADAGVDLFNLSCSYYTNPVTDIARIRAMVPNVRCYYEMCHCTYTGKKVTKRDYDSVSYRRTTPRQYYTAAHLAYSRGMDGISLFNFVYYRSHGGEERGPFNEPPFDVLERLGDREWLAAQPQHYLIARDNTNTPIRRRFEPTESQTYAVDMAPPTGGWKKGGRCRIQMETPMPEKMVWNATLNGTQLETCSDRSEPYGAPYAPLTGEPNQHRAWIVPVDLLKDGQNEFTVVYEGDKTSPVIAAIDFIVE